MYLRRLTKLTFSLITVLSLIAKDSMTSGNLVHKNTTSTKHCYKVKEKYELMKIGPGNMVPLKEIHDPTMDLCFKSARSKTKASSCCTRKMEKKFTRAAKNDFVDVLRFRSSYLKNMLVTSASDYQSFFHELINIAENNTRTLLTNIYKIPLIDKNDFLTSIYKDLHDYIKHKDINIDASVEKFFDELFPLVFHHNVMNDNTEYTQEYMKCLRGVRHTLNPVPFRKVPQSVSLQLQRAFTTTRTFIDTLGLAIEVINTTDHLKVETYCARSLAKMKYCPLCRGMISARPCNLYCRNVLRGCLGSVQDIDGDWNNFVNSFIKYTKHIDGHFNIEKILMAFDSRVSEAIMHAMEQGPIFYSRVVEKCDLPKLDRTVKKAMKHSGPSRPVAVSSAISLPKRLESLIENLKESKGFYAKLADSMCRTAPLSAPASEDGACWTGNDVGSYMKMLVNTGIAAQANNPEVKVLPLRTTAVVTLQDKLVHVKKMLDKKVYDNTMQADQIDRLVIKLQTSHLNKDRFSGSGDGPIDDEDHGGSGSGNWDIFIDRRNPNSERNNNGVNGGLDWVAPTISVPNGGPMYNTPKTGSNKQNSASLCGVSIVAILFMLSAALWVNG